MCRRRAAIVPNALKTALMWRTHGRPTPVAETALRAGSEANLARLGGLGLRLLAVVGVEAEEELFTSTRGHTAAGADAVSWKGELTSGGGGSEGRANALSTLRPFLPSAVERSSAISTAALPHCKPWLFLPDERSLACASVLVVSTPKMTGTPVDRPMFIRAPVTVSAITSKWYVSPFISRPTGMTASTVPESAM